MIAEKTKIRCAIYTRKSVDDGTLDSQEFSSLDAQREAGEAYILSQKANGWECLPEHYDDGGFSGGNINRPALIRLLDDIKAGKIDMVVVYKLDRLSRSLTDFSDLQEIFEQYHVSFCSVTQEINTSTPAGRMMLNILMSFGQYERELVAERTRDKYVASRKRGMWMGGFVPYGYRSENKKIFPDPTEAPVVKRMFQRFVETQSPKLIAHELNQDGLTSRKKKAWVNTYVARILKNPVYVGDVEYKGEIFKGEHEAIVSRQTWNRVQEIIKSNCPYERSGGITEITVPLKGILRCGHCGCAMIPVFCTKGKKRYYYYYCNTDYHRSEKLCPVGKIGSNIIEDAVKEQTVRIFSSTFFQETISKATGITVAELQRIFRDEFWLECSSLELNRLYSELFEKITVHEHQLAYEIKTSGIKAVIEGIMNI